MIGGQRSVTLAPLRGAPLRGALLCCALIGCALVGCSGDPKPAGMARPVPELAVISAATMDKWSRSCALCHIRGEGGAPRIGVAEDWQPRLAGGHAALITHTIEGFNNMPPLGYCMSCEREDFEAMIEFMAGLAR